MTRQVVGLAADKSEPLLQELFAHPYDPACRWDHQWRDGDLVVWGSHAVNHARPNVHADGPARTLGKLAFPMPQLRPNERPTYSTAQ